VDETEIAVAQCDARGGAADGRVGEQTILRMNKVADRQNDSKPARRRDWRRIHHSPLFWFGFALFCAAIAIYVLSDDLSWRPRLR
jgi:hypothetical protein